MNQETILQRAIMIALSNAGCTVFRNETGSFWAGQKIHGDAATITLKNPRMVKVGLCVGSSDIIGITKQGRFISIEVKTEKGIVSKEQQTFIDAIKSKNGIAGIARSVQDAIQLVQG
jgi:hypothetical protein